MIRVPRDFNPLIDELSSATRHRQTAQRLFIFFAVTVVVGDRTVSAVIRLLSIIEMLNPSTYHRLFSYRKWSSRKYARIIAHYVIDRFFPDGIVRIVGDETVDGHRDKKVDGKDHFDFSQWNSAMTDLSEFHFVAGTPPMIGIGNLNQ